MLEQSAKGAEIITIQMAAEIRRARQATALELKMEELAAAGVKYVVDPLEEHSDLSLEEDLETGDLNFVEKEEADYAQRITRWSVVDGKVLETTIIKDFEQRHSIRRLIGKASYTRTSLYLSPKQTQTLHNRVIRYVSPATRPPQPLKPAS